MPLSDAARALLRGKLPGARPADPAAQPPAPEPAEPVDPQHQGFRDRAAREDERFRLATDPEFWVAICFRKPGQPAAFAAAFGLTADEHNRYVPGPKLAARVGDRTRLTAKQRAMQLLRVQAGRATDMTADLSPVKGTDPLTTITYTGDLAADSLAELRAIHAALNAPPPTRPADVLDSPYWLAAYWPSREDKEQFLTASGLDVLGDKYLDGHQAARILGIDLS